MYYTTYDAERVKRIKIGDLIARSASSQVNLFDKFINIYLQEEKIDLMRHALFAAAFGSDDDSGEGKSSE